MCAFPPPDPGAPPHTPSHTSQKLFPAPLHRHSGNPLLCYDWGGFFPRIYPLSAPPSLPFCFPRLVGLENAASLSLCMQISMCKGHLSTCFFSSLLIVLCICILPAISQQMCLYWLLIVWWYAWLVCVLLGRANVLVYWCCVNRIKIYRGQVSMCSVVHTTHR